MKEYIITRDGEYLRRVSLPDHEDVGQQLEPGEIADSVDPTEPRPGAVLQP